MIRIIRNRVDVLIMFVLFEPFLACGSKRFFQRASRACAVFLPAAAKPARFFVRTAARAAAERSNLVRRRAAECAWREMARGLAAAWPSRFNAPSVARLRRRE